MDYRTAGFDEPSYTAASQNHDMASTNPSQSDLEMGDGSPNTSQSQAESSDEQDVVDVAKNSSLDAKSMPPPRPRPLTPLKKPDFGSVPARSPSHSDAPGFGSPDVGLRTRPLTPLKKPDFQSTPAQTPSNDEAPSPVRPDVGLRTSDLDSPFQRRNSSKRMSSGELKPSSPVSKRVPESKHDGLSSDTASGSAQAPTRGHHRQTSELSARLQNTLAYAMVKVQNGWQDRALTPDEHAYAMQQARDRHAGLTSPGATSPKCRRMSTEQGVDAVSPNSARSPVSWSRGHSRPCSSPRYLREHPSPYRERNYADAGLSPSSPQGRPEYYGLPRTPEQTSPARAYHRQNPFQIPEGSAARPLDMPPPMHQPRSAARLWEQEQDAADTLLAMGSASSRDPIRASPSQKRSRQDYAASDEQRVDRLLDDIRNEEMS